jgi:hypothetical protein
MGQWTQPANFASVSYFIISILIQSVWLPILMFSLWFVIVLCDSCGLVGWKKTKKKKIEKGRRFAARGFGCESQPPAVFCPSAARTLSIASLAMILSLHYLHTIPYKLPGVLPRVPVFHHYTDNTLYTQNFTWSPLNLWSDNWSVLGTLISTPFFWFLVKASSFWGYTAGS